MNKTRMISTGLKQFFLACMEFGCSKQHVCLNAHSFIEQCSYLRRATISSSEANIVVSIKESLGPSLGSKNAFSALPSCFQQTLSMLFVPQIVPIFFNVTKEKNPCDVFHHHNGNSISGYTTGALPCNAWCRLRSGNQTIT